MGEGGQVPMGEEAPTREKLERKVAGTQCFSYKLASSGGIK